MKPFQYILFDWDGTLSNSLPIWLDSYKLSLKKHNVVLQDSHISRYLFPNMGAAQTYGIKDMKEFSVQVLETAHANIHTAKLHLEVEKTIQSLYAKKKRLAIVTSTEKMVITQSLSQHNLRKYFDVVLAREDVVKKKPDPEIVYKAMDMLGAAAESTIIVGDSEADINAGKRAGIKTVMHYPKENELFYSEDLIHEIAPDYIIRSLSKLLEIVS